VNFVTIGVWDEMYGFIMALVVFLSTLKFINMLKFNRRMGMLTDTIRLAAKDMKAFVITFFIYFFAFAQLGYLLFGSVLPTYSSFVHTIESLFSLRFTDSLPMGIRPGTKTVTVCSISGQVMNGFR